MASFLPHVVGKAAVIGPAVAADPSLASLTSEDLISRLLLSNETLRAANARLEDKVKSAQQVARDSAHALDVYSKMAKEYGRLAMEMDALNSNGTRTRTRTRTHTRTRTRSGKHGKQGRSKGKGKRGRSKGKGKGKQRRSKSKGKGKGIPRRATWAPESIVPAVPSVQQGAQQSVQQGAQQSVQQGAQQPLPMDQLPVQGTDTHSPAEDAGENALAPRPPDVRRPSVSSAVPSVRSQVRSIRVLKESRRRPARNGSTLSTEGTSDPPSWSDSSRSGSESGTGAGAEFASGAEDAYETGPSGGSWLDDKGGSYSGRSSYGSSMGSETSGGEPSSSALSARKVEMLKDAVRLAQADRDSLQLRYESVLSHYENAYSQLAETQRRLREAMRRERVQAESFKVKLAAAEARGAQFGRRKSVSLAESRRGSVHSMFSTTLKSVSSTGASGAMLANEGDASGAAAETAAALAEAHTRIAELETELGDANAKVSSLWATVASKDEIIGEIQAERDALVKEVQRLRRQVRELQLSA